MENQEQYIGELKVVEFIDGKVKFEGGKEEELNAEVYNKIVSDKKGVGLVIDVLREYFARKFIAELASLDLKFYVAQHVSIGMKNLSENLREDAVGRKFNCSNSFDIKLRDLIV